MILIDGKKIAAELREELKKEVSNLKTKYNKVPGLTVILIGDLTPSQIYVRNKEKSAKEVGLKSEILKYYSYVVVANVIISWLIAFNVLNTGNRFVYMVLDFTYRMTEPFLSRIRRFLPNLGALDISPIILLMLIWIIQMCMEYYIKPIL